MAKLTELFSNQGQTYRHPLIRFIDSEHPENPKIEVDRPRDVLGFKSASIFFHWTSGGKAQAPRQYAWEPELNAELVRRQIRSIDENAEVVRFGLAFKEAFKRPEIRYGDGFFNAVLIIAVKELGFHQEKVVADVLEDITPGNPHMGGGSYEDCKELIKGIIRARANELVNELKYTEDGASTVSVGAVAYYLDERFSVSNRRRLGF